MGDNFGVASGALPVRPVTVSAFFIDCHEVSLSLWNEVCSWAKLHGYDFDNPGQAIASNHPANGIDWYDAVKWCNARSEKAGIGPVYFTDGNRTAAYRTGRLDLAANCVDWLGSGYRLPTEAEWEKAARGGLAGQHYPWPSTGSDYSTQIRGEQANFWNSGDPWDNGTAPVGFYDGHQSVTGQDMANGFGLYDMAGNVDEMCWDWYGAYAPGAQTDPRGAQQGDRRVTRGGSWYNNALELRCCARRPIWPGLGGVQSGFRCARSVAP
jgi:formylglycine-generating enzyme required for sulfatase activity